MNALIEPRSTNEGALGPLTRAKALIEAHDFDAAALLYLEALEDDLAPLLRGEVLTNLGAALCMSAQGQPGPAALARLEHARSMLVDSLPLRSRINAPEAWATTRANLALVYRARYEITGNQDDLLSAHMALDDTEAALRVEGASALRDWIRVIRDELIELRDRRSKRRR